MTNSKRTTRLYCGGHLPHTPSRLEGHECRGTRSEIGVLVSSLVIGWTDAVHEPATEENNA